MFRVDVDQVGLQLLYQVFQGFGAVQVPVPLGDVFVSDLGSTRGRLDVGNPVAQVVVLLLRISLVLLPSEVVLQVRKHIRQVLEVLVTVSGRGWHRRLLTAQHVLKVLDVAGVPAALVLKLLVLLLRLLVDLGESGAQAGRLLLQRVQSLLDVVELDVAVGLVSTKFLLRGELVIEFFAEVVTQLVNSVKELAQLVSTDGWSTSVVVAGFALGAGHLEHLDVVQEFADLLVVLIQLLVH